MEITVYGLDNCDTCRKARSWLQREGIAHEFVDYRRQPIAPAQLKAWAAAVGGWEKFVNRASPTWRKLPEARKKPGSDPEWTLLIREYPALVRRPLLVQGETVLQGFNEARWREALAGA